jgi:hypothetical protein
LSLLSLADLLSTCSEPIARVVKNGSENGGEKHRNQKANEPLV